jgi:multidrug efflux system membrane fusion protein
VLAGCGANSSADIDATGGKGKGKGRGKGDFGGPVPIMAARVSQRNVPIEVQVVGNVEAYSVVSVRPQVSGQLTSVNVKDGDYVQKGATLFTIDPRTLEGQLAQAEANLARSRAQLAQAEANLARDIAQEQFTKGVAERYEKLVAEGVMSKDQGEQQRTNANVQAQAVAADRAAIASARAQIEADTAAVNNIKLQLSYTTITAPIDGRLGNVTMKLGNIVTANNTELMQILQVEPIYVSFAVPESRLAEVKRYMERSTLPVAVRPQDGSGDAESGQLTFVDNAVDTTTGTIRLKGTFRNSGHKLWPGQFVNVTLRLTTRPNAAVVPNQAVQTGQDGTFVYVVKEDNTVEVRPIITGPRVDTDMVIEQGLKPGETVVTEGQLRLQPGSRVQIRGGITGNAPRGAEAPPGEPAANPAGGAGKRGKGKGDHQGNGRPSV